MNDSICRTTTIREHVTGPRPAFRDRAHAGDELADHMGLDPDPAAQVLAIPRGGVAVGRVLADRLNAPLAPVFVRKLPIPDSPEAGFGAVALDGSTVLNDWLVNSLGLSSSEIDTVVSRVLAEVSRRAGRYRVRNVHDTLKDRTVYLVDDGLASGYTALAAIKMIRGHNPARLVVAVPVSPMSSIRMVEEVVDGLHCLIAQAQSPFAVASFYRSFPDLTDEQVEALLAGNR